MSRRGRLSSSVHKRVISENRVLGSKFDGRLMPYLQTSFYFQTFGHFNLKRFRFRYNRILNATSIVMRFFLQPILHAPDGGPYIRFGWGFLNFFGVFPLFLNMEPRESENIKALLLLQLLRFGNSFPRDSK